MRGLTATVSAWTKALSVASQRCLPCHQTTPPTIRPRPTTPATIRGRRFLSGAGRAMGRQLAWNFARKMDGGVQNTTPSRAFLSQRVARATLTPRAGEAKRGHGSVEIRVPPEEGRSEGRPDPAARQALAPAEDGPRRGDHRLAAG